MKKARMNISHSRFILSKLKIFGEIVTTLLYCQKLFALTPTNRRFAEKNRLSGNTDI